MLLNVENFIIGKMRSSNHFRAIQKADSIGISTDWIGAILVFFKAGDDSAFAKQ